MTRLIGLAYGVAVYVFFLAVFLYAIGFVANVPWLPKTIDSGAAASTGAALVINVVLLGLFAVQHSVMARRGFKRWWTKLVPAFAERSTYVLAATLVLALVMWQWRAMPGAVWSVESASAQWLLWAVFGLGWLTVLVATFMIDHFELFGLRQVYDHWRGRDFVSPGFKTPGLYRFVRHPIYFGFAVAFWATPQMSVGHLLFAIATTGYILVGIWFEERDLVAHFGERYREYRQRVPMLLPVPFLKAGRSGQQQAGQR